MPSHSAAERLALATELRAAGPGAPTLCAGWTTTELAAHLVVRERRPDTLPGLVLPPAHPLHRWTSRVEVQYGQRDYAGLVEDFRSGPHLGSWAALPGIDARVNLLEHYVHCEDVRRAIPGWSPRELPAGRQRALWAAIRQTGRMLLRRSPVPVVFQLPDGPAHRVVAGTGVSANRPGVVITGDPGELVLCSFGRGDQAQVTVAGPDEDLAAFAALNPGI